MIDPLTTLTQLGDAVTPQARVVALARGAAACVPKSVASALLFTDEGVAQATEPSASQGFALRDGSPAVRRLFLHALEPFMIDGVASIARDRQRGFAGVSSTLGHADLLFVPLRVREQTLGVVALIFEGVPSAASRATLAAYCAAAERLLDADRALVLAQRESRSSQLLTLVNERLYKSLDRSEVLAGIVEGVRADFSAQRAMVCERTPNGEHAVIVASTKLGDAESSEDSAIVMDADLRKVFAGVTVRLDDSGSSGAFGFSAASAIAVPLIVDGKAEEALILTFDRARAIDDSDVVALRSLAFHVGLALANARLYARERARRMQAETLERVVRILRDTQYVDEVLMVFAVTVSHELPVDCAAYALEGDRLMRRALRLREPRGIEPEASISRSVIEPFLAVDEPSDESLVPRTVRGALFDEKRGVIVPLRVDGILWGMFVARVVDETLDWPDDERTVFFRTLGSHLEIALANAHAYERELRRGKERETLAEAARSILSHTSIAPLAAVMCRLGASLVHADQACVLRWTGARYDSVGTFGNQIEDLVKSSGFDTERRAEPSEETSPDDRRVQRLIDGPGHVMIPLARVASAENASGAVDAFLLVGHSSGARFGRDDLRLLQELGALLALALHNLELYEAMSLTNRALQESSEFKDDLLAMLAHDFKGPLTVILGYCELLLEGKRDTRDEIETIYAQTKRLVRLSEDALVLAQTQSAGFSLARTVVDLGAFVAECIEVGAKNNARIKLESSSEILPVELDPQRFRHVIDNLLQNALKYSQSDVHVSVRREQGRAVISVTDQGIGIPAEELATLFTRFARASNARETGVAGSGVGLYVARKIVAVHGGEIAVVSRENEGTTFSVTLPLATATNL